MKGCKFERALFLSWYCSRGDCAYCYMSTQKKLISDPLKARRSFSSIFAEAEIAVACGWEIEFLSGGYESFSVEELVYIAKRVSEITGKRQWLNIGAMQYEELIRFQAYAEGYVGTLECANPDLRKKLCPSKPLGPILQNYKDSDRLGMKKAATVIIGLGETMDDYSYLKQFITENGISRVTFYSLNPQKGTAFTDSPAIEYYENWVVQTRSDFPGLHITAGAWSDKAHYFSRLLLAGADNITKLPVFKIFGTGIARQIENEAERAGRAFVGTLTQLPRIGRKLPPDIRNKVDEYLLKMSHS